MRAQRAQAAQAHRTRGRAVTVVIGDDDEVLVRFDRVGKVAGSGVDAQ